MSLDIWLEGEEEDTLFEKNITSNLRMMWRESNLESVLYNSEGMQAKEVLPDLEDGLTRLKGAPEYFKQFDAPNGWGLYKHAVPWVEDLIEGFKQYPDGKIKISV